MAMKPKLFLKQNIDVSKEGCNEWYPSSIQDIRDDKLFITIPARASYKLLIHGNELVDVNFVQDNALFHFTTTCLGVIEDNISLYCLSEPKEFKRVQRRRNVRTATTLDVYYSLDNQDTKPVFKKTTALDISGGGLRISTSEPVEVGTILYVCFYLPGVKAPAEISTKCKVVRCEPVETKGKKRIYHLGLDFQDISRTEQDNIVKYVFNLMIKQNRLR